MTYIVEAIVETWHILLDSSVYILFGLLVGGWLKVFLNPGAVARHLGQDRMRSVFKAALFGIPLPLCSCGVLPAALSLKKQGASNGAVTAFMISTPESGVDSIAVTFALMDPIMTIARPVAGFITAAVAGIAEILFGRRAEEDPATPDLPCPSAGCCGHDHNDQHDHEKHEQPHSFPGRLVEGARFAFIEFWGELAGWFFIGLLLAGVITAFFPQDIFSRYLGGGFSSMLIMLAIGIPLYICATASTPIAAALILKGVSPGAALVFLLAGPATNVTSLTVLVGILGKRATAIYLTAISVCAVLFGLMVDGVYFSLGLSAQATVGQVSDIMPGWAEWAGALFLLLISIQPVARSLISRFSFHGHSHEMHSHAHSGQHDHSHSLLEK